MNRKVALSLLLGFVLVAGSAVLAATQPTAKAPEATQAAGPAATAAVAPVTLVADPYLQAATVSTSTLEAKNCYDAVMNCSGYPQGYDCGTPAGTCHCSGPVPATRVCVLNR